VSASHVQAPLMAKAQALPPLIVLWQSPVDEGYVAVGRLDFELLTGGTLDTTFNYLPGAANTAGFRALESFPELETTYVTAGLPPFFASRLMDRSRPDFPRYVADLDLIGEPEAWEELAVTGGERATDSFTVFPLPMLDEHRGLSLKFFVHGLRHLDVDEDVLARLEPGQLLELVRELDNPVDARAELVITLDGVKLGWLPRWLQGVATDIRLSDPTATLRLVKVNGPGRRASRRVLCRLDAVMPEDWTGFELDRSLAPY
jgi:hypothetical protein